MKAYFMRIVRLLLGVGVSALGVYFMMQANIGLAPWDALAVGISLSTGVSVGTATIIIAALSLSTAALLHEKAGIGTVAAAFQVGIMLDIFYAADFLPPSQNIVLGVGMLFFGMVLIALGGFLYIGAALGCGPRDALMIAVAKRMMKVPLGLIRGVLDVVVLAAGWALGAQIGLGTVITVACYGPLFQLVLRLLRFDARSVQHDSLIDSYRCFIGLRTKAQPVPAAEQPVDGKE